MISRMKERKEQGEGAVSEGASSHFLLNLFKDFGERPPLKRTFEDINSDLQFAYQYVSQYVSNKSVLDFGCGGGYGSEFMSRFTTRKTVGFDVNRCAVNTAKAFFSTGSNLEFTDEVPQERFDIITSFQVIEHIAPSDLPQYFKGICSHLQPDGQVFIATPNKNITSYGLEMPIMPFHKIEYTPEALEQLLKNYFRHVAVFGQIDQNTADKVSAGGFAYSDLSRFSVKQRMIRMISQMSPIRFFARHTPQELKNFILGRPQLDTTPQLLTQENWMIENSYILIAQCQP
jgi:2-polyprenyl-3-methyl-5-hydroxy-6-metoxy-1,4-benzoquinol methylase